MSTSSIDLDVRGEVAPGFEPVREAFAEHGTELAPGGGAFCAYVEGKQVVDLHVGDAAPGRPWRDDTMGILFSASKGVSTLVTQVVVERGLLDIDAPVGDYWPEFACNGKERTLVRHFLEHRSGVVMLPEWDQLIGWDGTGMDRYDEIAARLAAATPAWEPGTRHGYHALTFGWLVGELVRRTTGRSLGTYLQEEIAEPLGLDLHLGVSGDDYDRVAQVIDRPPPGPDAPEILLEIWKLWHDPSEPAGQAFFAGPEGNLFDHLGGFIGSRKTLASEFGAGAATGTARSVARMYALLGEGGTLDGVTLLSPERVTEWATERVAGIDDVLRQPWRWALGYHLQTESFTLTLDGEVPPPLGPNFERAFGHCGHGGQVGGVDPDRRLAVGFVRNKLGEGFTPAGVLVDAVIRCLD